MSSKCYDYLAHIGEILEKVKTTQWDSIEKSAKKMAETIVQVILCIFSELPTQEFWRRRCFIGPEDWP